jgi:nicotinamide-nucleotide adenylyltransferase
MKALFIGRFQPFHKGHLKILQSISKKYDEIIIGIGSSQYSNEIENPFSEEERKMMIIKSLDEIGLNNYIIISIPDIHNPPFWVPHVLSIISDFDVVITNNSLTKKLFSEKGCKVVDTPFYEKEKYSGRNIRKRMIKGLVWADLVPISVVKIVNEINGVQRLKNLS